MYGLTDQPEKCKCGKYYDAEDGFMSKDKEPICPDCNRKEQTAIHSCDECHESLTNCCCD